MGTGCQAPIFEIEKSEPHRGTVVSEKLDCPHKWPNLDVCFTYSGLEQVRVNEEARVHLVIPDADQGKRLAQLTLKAYLWMPEHGHGSAPLRVDPVSESEIFLHNLWLVMPGLWHLHLQWMNQEQVVAEYVVAIEL